MRTNTGKGRLRKWVYYRFVFECSRYGFSLNCLRDNKYPGIIVRWWKPLVVFSIYDGGVDHGTGTGGKQNKVEVDFAIELLWKWYDLWIGAYIDKDEKTIYICPFPTVVIKLKFVKREW